MRRAAELLATSRLPAAEARALLALRLQVPRERLIAHPEIQVEDEDAAAFEGAAARRLAAGDDPEFHRAKIGTARFFADHMLVTAGALAATATEGSAGTLALSDEQF